MTDDMTPEQLQKVVNEVAEVIPTVPWTKSFSDGRRSLQTWSGAVEGYRFIVSEFSNPKTGECSCHGSVGIIHRKTAMKLPPELAKTAVRHAKGGA